jgi:poly(3-hydroxybutyrate) depolymerase
MLHGGVPVDPAKVHRVALMTVEGEKDDISGIGQTGAAQTLCKKLPETMRAHHLQPDVGHYGVFNGSRFRAEILPKIRDFIRANQRRRGILARAFG